MKDALEKLKEFHRVFDCDRADAPRFLNLEQATLRINLMQEELKETILAIQELNMEEIADGLADLCYVVIGTAVAYGIPLDRVFEEVHRANMKKAEECTRCYGTGRKPILGPTEYACTICSGTGKVVRRREDGKILKPAGWTPPDIHSALYPPAPVGFGMPGLKKEGTTICRFCQNLVELCDCSTKPPTITPRPANE